MEWASLLAGREAEPPWTEQGRGKGRERGAIPEGGGIRLGWLGKEIWGDAFVEAQKREPGTDHRRSSLEEHRGYTGVRGVSDPQSDSCRGSSLIVP